MAARVRTTNAAGLKKKVHRTIDAAGTGRHSASLAPWSAPEYFVPNILVADDNPVSLRFFAEALTQLGVSSELAHDGLETVAKAERARFDVLLLDARMPGLDGAGALARIRNGSGPSRDAIAIATTAEAGDRARRELTEAGFVDVVAKPVTLVALRKALAPHLAGSIEGDDASAEVADDALDDVRALSAVGGDVSILSALRGLFVAELDALPAEIADIGARADVVALRDRLHRLDASAGFCGAPALVRACAKVRLAVDQGASWPDAAIAEFLDACADVRAKLVNSGASPAR